MDFLIPIDLQSKTALYEQIYRYIRDAIKEQRLQAGERLASGRALAEHLHISRQTVSVAYEQLVAEGYVEAKKNRGYFVRAYDKSYDLSGTYKEEEKEATDKKEDVVFDLSPGGIDFSLFPLATWRKLAKETLRKDNIAIFSKGEAKGEYLLRSEIARYLYHSRGIRAKAKHIVLAAGTEQLFLFLQLLLQKDSIAIENPSYKHWSHLFATMGLRVEAVDIDAEGMMPDKLQESGADIAVITPNHHYPTGTLMPVSRRMQILEWLHADKKRYVIEDDYDSEFRYKGRPIPAMASMDNSGRFIYIGTFSRAIAPSIRISFMLLPAALMGVYEERLSFMSCTVPRIDQDILYRFMAGGYFERHLNRVRAAYKAKHDLIVSTFKEYEDSFEILGDNSGAHLLLRAKYAVSEEELIARAAAVKVRLYPLSAFYAANSSYEGRATLLLGFASISKEKLEKALALVIGAWMAEDGKDNE